MEYTIKQKELRPAGDWLVIAESEEGKVYHGTFASEPTATEVDELAKEKAAKALAQDKADEEANAGS